MPVETFIHFMEKQEAINEKIMITLVKLEVLNATQTEILKNIDEQTKHVHGEQTKQFSDLENRVANNEKWIERIIGGSIMLAVLWGVFQFVYPLLKK